MFYFIQFHLFKNYQKHLTILHYYRLKIKRFLKKAKNSLLTETSHLIKRLSIWHNTIFLQNAMRVYEKKQLFCNTLNVCLRGGHLGIERQCYISLLHLPSDRLYSFPIWDHFNTLGLFNTIFCMHTTIYKHQNAYRTCFWNKNDIIPYTLFCHLPFSSHDDDNAL